MRLPSVSQQDDEDDDEEQPPPGGDAEDGGEGEQAVGADVDLSWGDVEASDLDLGDNDHTDMILVRGQDFKILTNPFQT